MKDKRLKQLKKDYMDTPIPEELDFMIERTLKDRRMKMKKQKNIRRILIPAASIAAAFTITVVGVNTSPSMADSLGNIPIIGNVVKVLTFREYNVDEDGYHGNIVTPEIEGLENEDLQSSLNEKYLEENKKLYDEFMSEVEELKENGGGHLGVDSGYVVKTDTDEILAIGRYTVNTVASSSTEFKYDTISKKDNVLITLPSLFEDDKYVEIISENIKEQMINENKSDESKIYWVEGVEDTIEGFKEISPDQSFYINEDNKLVISFDKYEVAPGYMGVIEFVIPTEILSDVLVSDDYIK
jgi:uncharacterized protein DUF3298